MPRTYEPIASQTVSAAASVTFSSLPQTFTDLIVIFVGTTGSTPDVYRLNGDTGTNYSDTYLLGTGSAASSGRFSSQGASRAAINGLGVHTVRLQILSYSNTSVFKTTLVDAASASGWVERFASLYRSTSAITSFTYLSDTTVTGTVSLYGIKAA
jgi:hypothetical protein